ncbi:putative transcription factor Rap1 [Aspergillus stella-maris]|uniref:putative transcription factor Rap1 n=1 Tax=Aspergillus stella-maris TaxID=1810926 RepID=UPI003CCE04D3
MASGQGEADGHSGQAENEDGGIFQGMSFWLSRNVPQRSRFKEDIERNGGVVRLNEKDADVQIVDHKRKNLPPNVYSFQFIEKSITRGILQDLEDYRVGPSTSRPVGATHIPTKGQRSSYTIGEDQILYDYMQLLERDSRVSIQGNKIYQEFAEKHPSHPWQSWRDRYLKRVRGRPRPGGSVQPNATTTTESSTRPTSSRSAQMAARRTDSPSNLQQKKRKRSPGPTERGERASSDTTNTKLRKPTSRSGGQRASEVVLPPDSLVQIRQKSPAANSRALNSVSRGSPTKYRAPQVVVPAPTPSNQRRRESPRHEHPQSPIKEKATTKQTPEIPATPEKPTEQAKGKAPAQSPVAEPNADIENSFWELPSLPPSPAPSEPSQDVEDEPNQGIDAWIDDRLSKGKGTEEQIIEAMRCTSMDPELADKVLETLVAGKGIPTDMRGVWTAEDDKYLEAQDSRQVQRVLEKHGDLFSSRWEYLRMVREDQKLD